MTPERWLRVQEVFDAASALPPGPDRDRIVESACASDDELRREVLSLLAAAEGGEGRGGPDDGTTEPFAGRWLAPVLRELSDTDAAGRRVGPYRILREIGVGGMGTVYLAERDDEQFRQLVALKLARRDIRLPGLRDRFLGERQILASLSHSHIARLLDGGVTEDGQPYFAMEYVDGETIDRHCDERALSVPERLRLFMQVCEGVRHAHRNLVIHRDLKPSNILVTRDGTARLLDFGIAKLLAPEEIGSLEPVTRTGQRWVTPAYASPEQVLGAAITTASDVYSLGVLLYELLSGHLPHDLGGKSAGEVERILALEAPSRPSEACTRSRTLVDAAGERRVLSAEEIARARSTQPERLRRRLAGDLDTIVLKALQNEANRRYESVEGLVEDLQRHLDGMPVRARPDSIAYRARKFAGRHRLALTAVAALFVFLVAGLAGTSWQARVAARERDRARIAAAEAQRINAFIQEMLSSADPRKAQGREVTVREILDDASGKAQAELSDLPEVRAAIQRTIGRTYLALGHYDPARSNLEAALDTRMHLHGRDHAKTAESLDDLGTLYIELGQYANAESVLTQALEATRAAMGEEHPDVATAVNNLAVLFQSQGRFAESEPLLRNVIARNRRLYGPGHPSAAAALTNLASALDNLGKLDESESLAREAIAAYRAADPERPLDLARGLNNLGLLLRRQGKLEESEGLLREALDIRRRILGPEHLEVAAGMQNLAFVVRARGRLDEAETLFRGALDSYERIFDVDHPNLAGVLFGLGSILAQRGEPREAEIILRRSVEIQKRTPSPDGGRLAMAENVLGEAIAAQGRDVEAESLMARSVGPILRSPAVSPAIQREALERVVRFYERSGRDEKAAAYRAVLDSLDRAGAAAAPAAR